MLSIRHTSTRTPRISTTNDVSITRNLTSPITGMPVYPDDTVNNQFPSLNSKEGTKKYKKQPANLKLATNHARSGTKSILHKTDENTYDDKTDRVNRWVLKHSSSEHITPPDLTSQHPKHVTFVPAAEEQQSMNMSTSPPQELPKIDFKIRRSSYLPVQITDSLPDIDLNHQNNEEKILQTKNHDEDEEIIPLYQKRLSLAPLYAPRLRRSSNPAMSVSTAASRSSITYIPSVSKYSRPSLSSTSYASTDGDYASSDTDTIVSKPSVASRRKYFNLLQYNDKLSDEDHLKLEEIRDKTPDEFEQLLPTLIRYGVISSDTLLSDDEHNINKRRLLSIIKDDNEQIEHKRYLEHLYGSVIVDHKKQLRNALTFTGQYSLLNCYKDEIARELELRVKNWQQIKLPTTVLNISKVPTKKGPTFNNLSELTSSNGKSTSLSSSLSLGTLFRAKQKFFTPLRMLGLSIPEEETSDYADDGNISTATSTTLISATKLRRPATKRQQQLKQIEQEENEMLQRIFQNVEELPLNWREKCISKIIEQGMVLLDQVRKLPLLQNENNFYDSESTTQSYKQLNRQINSVANENDPLVGATASSMKSMERIVEIRKKEIVKQYR
ncbi:unnamed protein product, partial [Didymodactylos carnosus]